MDGAKGRPALTGAPAARALAASLFEGQNTDGGWGAQPGLPSDVEASALGLLALAGLGAEARVAAGRAVAWLGATQRPDGSWPFRAGHGEPSWATGLAVLALWATGLSRERAGQGARWLLGQFGRRPGWIALLLYRLWPSAMPVRMNPELRGWPWARDTFSWVEPTAYSLLALKHTLPVLDRRAAEARISEAELMLYDRMCDGGGWNYGNSNVFGTSVPPYPETTALTLVALQDHARVEPNRRSLEALHRMLETARSGLILAWAAICLALYGEEPAALRQALAETWERTRFLGSVRSTALALIALSHQHQVFAAPRP